MILCVLQNINRLVRSEIGYGARSECCIPLPISFWVYQKELEEYVSLGLHEGLLDVKVKLSCGGRFPKRRHRCDGVFSLTLVIVFLPLWARFHLWNLTHTLLMSQETCSLNQTTFNVLKKLPLQDQVTGALTLGIVVNINLFLNSYCSSVSHLCRLNKLNKCPL